MMDVSSHQTWNSDPTPHIDSQPGMKVLHISQMQPPYKKSFIFPDVKKMKMKYIERQGAKKVESRAKQSQSSTKRNPV